MPVRIGNRTFAPGPVASLLALAVLAGLVSLGSWQLDRADEKRALLESFALGQSNIAGLSGATAAGLPRYQKVFASGRYLPEKQILLDNMPSAAGAPGYRVLTPFALDDGALVLVDRGWVPVGTDRRVLPDVAVDAAPRRITGLIDDLPRPGMRLGEPGAGPADWPWVVNFPTRAELAAVFGGGLLEPLVLLDAAQPDGFERQWEARFGFGPERHIGYAVQWFALSLAWLAIYFIVNLKANPRSPTGNP